MKTTALALLALACATSVCAAAPIAAPAAAPPAGSAVILADAQGPMSLPPKFRDHCAYDMFRGRWFCSNHCGINYQFYYCSPESFGCCHIGRGYCGWDGLLRCTP